jgi:hypothetical protein
MKDHSEGAKRRTERLRAARSDCLGRMSDGARRIFEEEIVPALRNGSRPQVLGDLWSADYEYKPVPIQEFIYDPFYLGASLRDNIYPAIVDDLVELFQGDYLEVVLAGSIGWGKSREAEVGIAYEIYQLSCMRDPAAVFGLIPGSTLAFLNVSVDKMQARKVLFRGLYDLLQRSPYFRKVFRYNPKLRTEIRFPKSIPATP